MIDYEVGTIPSSALTVLVKDELDNPVNVVGYDNWHIEMIGSDNEKVDLSGVNIVEIADVIGAFNVTWPKDRSIFNKKGKYLLRLVLSKQDGSRDITRAAEIRVRDFGRIK